jgi:hypothetical protein
MVCVTCVFSAVMLGGLQRSEDDCVAARLTGSGSVRETQVGMSQWNHGRLPHRSVLVPLGARTALSPCHVWDGEAFEKPGTGCFGPSQANLPPFSSFTPRAWASRRAYRLLDKGREAGRAEALMCRGG